MPECMLSRPHRTSQNHGVLIVGVPHVTGQAGAQRRHQRRAGPAGLHPQCALRMTANCGLAAAWAPVRRGCVSRQVHGRSTLSAPVVRRRDTPASGRPTRQLRPTVSTGTPFVPAAACPQCRHPLHVEPVTYNQQAEHGPFYQTVSVLIAGGLEARRPGLVGDKGVIAGQWWLAESVRYLELRQNNHVCPLEDASACFCHICPWSTMPLHWTLPDTRSIRNSLAAVRRHNSAVRAHKVLLPTPKPHRKNETLRHARTAARESPTTTSVDMSPMLNQCLRHVSTSGGLTFCSTVIRSWCASFSVVGLQEGKQ